MEVELTAPANLSPNSINSAALRLYDKGCRDLVRLNGKRPTDSGWLERTLTRSEIAEHHGNFGLRTRTRPTLDADLEDARLAKIVGDVTDQTIGRAPRRTGRAPRFAVVCKLVGEPIPKHILTIRERDGRDLGKVEILGDGQQVVIQGTHPDTGAPYSWANGTATGDASILCDALETLPVLSAAIIRDTLFPAIANAMQRIGLVTTTTGAALTDRAHVDQSSLLAPSIDDLRNAVAVLPNDERNYDRFVKVGYATKAAAGDDVEDGFDIFSSWAEKCDASNPAMTRSTWASLKPPFAVGWSWLAEEARPYGFNDAALTFDVVDGAAPLPSAVALATLPMQTAQLNGYPDRALAQLLDDATLVGQELRDARSEVLDAVNVPHPHERFYRARVLRAASSARSYASDLPRFTLALATELVDDVSWAGLSVQEKAVLSAAAFSHVADSRLLGGSATRDYGAFVSAESAFNTEWLIDSCIEKRSVGQIIGPSGVGKTTEAIAIAVAGSCGIGGIGGNAIRSAFSTLVFAREDPGGAWGRTQAAAAALKQESPSVYVVAGVPRLLEIAAGVELVLRYVDRIPAGAPPLGLIIIDHFRDAIGGADGNDGAVCTTAFNTAELCARATGAAVAIIDHTGHDTSRAAASGSKVKYDKSAFVLNLTQKEGSKTIAATWTKVKNAASGATMLFHLDGNVAVDGPAPRAESDGAIASDETLVDAVMQSIARSHSVSRKEIADRLAADFPARFDEGAAQVKRSTIAGRVSGALDAALGKGWIVQRAARFAIGESSPAKAQREKDELEFADVAGIV